MQTKAEIEKTLGIISKAWGRTQTGYCFFPYLDREEQERAGRRRAGYHEPAGFMWPRDKQKIVDYLHTKQDMDVYWCPSLFEFNERKTDNAMDEHALWADLDEVTPQFAAEMGYEPTIAWETSPGRYQALWLIASGDIQGASWAGNENQKLTYLLGADQSGWDTTQLLRIPGWVNHKPEYRNAQGELPKGKLLSVNGRQYQVDDFTDLPPVEGTGVNVTDALESEIDNVDRHKIIARIKIKLNHRARELLNAKTASGDLSEQLWYLTRCLADAGCTISEIVAITRVSVWNKFAGRSNEIRTLITEASKAISKSSTEKAGEGADETEDDDEKRQPLSRFSQLLINVKRPKFLVEGLITQGSCGFIAGEPKCYKSWVALDLCMAVAEGMDFLGHWRVPEPGGVIYIQEEDPLPTLKTRTAKIWAGKRQDKMTLVEDDNGTRVLWLPADEAREFDPDINAYVQQSFTISDEAWMLWLDDELSNGMVGKDGEVLPYKLLLLDTLMMTAGDVEENKSQEMTSKIFRPLKVLSRKHDVTLLLVHHMGKGEKARPGQRMLGSTANHAWAEDSLYISRPPTGKRIRIDHESKSVPSGAYAMENVEGEQNWEPHIEPWTADEKEKALEETKPKRKYTVKPSPTPKADRGFGKALQVMEVLAKGGNNGLDTKSAADLLGESYQTGRNRLLALEKYGQASTTMRRGKKVWLLTNKGREELAANPDDYLELED